jgi:ribosome maturation factor RimP
VGARPLFFSEMRVFFRTDVNGSQAVKEQRSRGVTGFFVEENVQKHQEKIRELAEAIVTAEGMELVEAECLRMPSRWLVRIFMDREGGVTLADCSEISHQLGDVLDVNDCPPGPYTLEVSSPGLDRPLVRDKDFLKYRGSTVNIRLRDKLAGIKHFKGELIDFIEEAGKNFLVVDVSGMIYRIPREMVSKAHLVYNIEGKKMEDN